MLVMFPLYLTFSKPRHEHCHHSGSQKGSQVIVKAIDYSIQPDCKVTGEDAVYPCHQT